MNVQTEEEQLKTWRNALSVLIGSYAQRIPAEEVKRFRGRMQVDIDNLPKEFKQ